MITSFGPFEKLSTHTQEPRKRANNFPKNEKKKKKTSHLHKTSRKMVALIRPALLFAVQVYCPMSLREMRGKTRVSSVDRVVPSRDHVIRGVGSPVAAHVRV